MAQSQDMHQTGIKKWGIYAAVNAYFWTSIGSLKIKTVNDWHGPLESIPTDSEIYTWKRVGTRGAFQGVILTGVHFDKSRLFLRLQAKPTQNPRACDII